MIYVTGDLHGEMSRFKEKKIKKLKKGDTLLVTGDFGFVWDGSKQEQKQLHALSKKKFTILFVPGTNDNYSLLAEYPEKEMFGAPVRSIAPNIAMLENGRVYTVEGKTVFAMGGGTTDDTVAELIPGETWWPEEQPSDAIREAGLKELEKHGWKVDYVLTHDVSSRIRGFLLMDHSEPSLLNYYLEDVSRKLSFTRWYFGCYHLDRMITASYWAVYRDVLPVNA